MAFCFRRGLRLVIVAAITLSALVAPPAARAVAASGSGLKSRGSSNDAQGSGKLRLANTSAFQARPFQDHDVSPRMVNGRSMERPAHRVASVTSVRPAMRSAPIARLRRAAMTLGPDRVLTCDLSSW